MFQGKYIVTLHTSASNVLVEFGCPDPNASYLYREVGINLYSGDQATICDDPLAI